MKKIIIICCSFFFIFFSCNSPINKSLKKEAPTEVDKFVLNGTLRESFSNKVYLNKILNNTLHPVDSAEITNKTFVFSGVVTYPERFALTFEDYATAIIFIVENKNFQIEIDSKNFQEPKITNSPLNYKLNEYKTHSKNIFKKIDYLFPQFQKARLENDANKLTEIGQKMKVIELEFSDFCFKFIENNNNSYVSGMILYDQLRSSTADTVKIKNAYKILSPSIKKGTDAKIVAEILAIH